MTTSHRKIIAFGRLPEVATDELMAQMSDPRVAEHMPLLTASWTPDVVERFVAAKEECWRRDGLGHWAIFCDGLYVGWGGFQKEEGEWDFGLVLKSESFGGGVRLTKKALECAQSDTRIPFITFLLPPSRTRLRALERLGATFVGSIDYDGVEFLKYRLETKGASGPG
jgi:hypothetical protein